MSCEALTFRDGFFAAAAAFSCQQIILYRFLANANKKIIRRMATYVPLLDFFLKSPQLHVFSFLSRHEAFEVLRLSIGNELYCWKVSC